LTSRGFAVVDVNYGGSTGYGRAYRERLRGRWGIVDVEDCINAANFLARRGDVDGKRMAIRGGSAGGYTTLCALVFHKVFAAGASYYGVADIEALRKDTHKFESRYEEGLVPPDQYRERSPVHFAERLSCPVILFQGLEDRIVPPSQAEILLAALKKNGIPFAYVAFPTEGHGFREAANIKRATEAELYFYSRVFGFTPADDIAPVEIENAEMGT
jgi:dipeptidyl aminopeptidase/acylaminoacyl peptidase